MDIFYIVNDNKNMTFSSEDEAYAYAEKTFEHFTIYKIVKYLGKEFKEISISK